MSKITISRAQIVIIIHLWNLLLQRCFQGKQTNTIKITDQHALGRSYFNTVTIFAEICLWYHIKPYKITSVALNITLTSWWPRWSLKSPDSRLFTQPLIQTQIKENIKAPRHWPLCGEFTGTGEFPAQRASYAENVSIWWRHHVCRKQQF